MLTIVTDKTKNYVGKQRLSVFILTPGDHTANQERVGLDHVSENT